MKIEFYKTEGCPLSEKVKKAIESIESKVSKISVYDDRNSLDNEYFINRELYVTPVVIVLDDNDNILLETYDENELKNFFNY